MEPTLVNENQILKALRQVPVDRWAEVLEFIGSLQLGPKDNPEPSATSEPAPGKRWTAAELRKLPREQRDAILAEQAALLEEEYRTNPELTGFEAFGKDDLYVDSSNTEPR